MVRNYEVERILNKKTYKGQIYYKIKWAGSSEPTWELASNCHCNYLIEQFEKKHREDGPADGEPNEVWEVEKILDKRITNNQVEYLVKWKDWPGEPTWELSDNCECFNLIAAYENPKLKKLWDFTGSNQNLWLGRKRMLRYMSNYIDRLHCRVHLLKFEPDFPPEEKQLELKEGINCGPLCYENHWYLIIILVNHICVTRRIMIGDALNTLVSANIKDHPVVKRLARVYTHFPIKPFRMTQMDRSDVCAYYTLAAFERAIYLLNPKAKFVAENVFFEASRAELIRSEVKPETDGEISVALPVPKAFEYGPMCEFCEKLFESRTSVDTHIHRRHITHRRSSN